MKKMKKKYFQNFFRDEKAPAFRRSTLSASPSPNRNCKCFGRKNGRRIEWKRRRESIQKLKCWNEWKCLVKKKFNETKNCYRSTRIKTNQSEITKKFTKNQRNEEGNRKILQKSLQHSRFPGRLRSKY